MSILDIRNGAGVLHSSRPTQPISQNSLARRWARDWRALALTRKNIIREKGARLHKSNSLAQHTGSTQVPKERGTPGDGPLKGSVVLITVGTTGGRGNSRIRSASPKRPSPSSQPRRLDRPAFIKRRGTRKGRRNYTGIIQAGACLAKSAALPRAVMLSSASPRRIWASLFLP